VRDRRQLVQLATLIFIFGIGALLRYGWVTERGLVYWDEAKFALEGERVSHLLLGGSTAGKAIGTAKPTHALVIALAYLLLGVSDRAPLLLDATCSLATIGLLYLLSQQLFNQPTARLAALLLAVSEYDLIYARSALSESDASLCLVGAVLAWSSRRASPRAQTRLLPGLLAGLGLTINYRLLVYLGVLVLVDLVWSSRVAGPSATVSRAGWWLTGLLLAPLLWQGIDLAARQQGLILFRSEVTGRPSWYGSELLYQLHEGKQARLHFTLLPYLQWYLLRQGLPASALLLAGLGLALWRRTIAWLLPACLVLLPAAAYTLAPFIVPRNLVAALPFACLLAAGGVTEVVQWLPGQRGRAVLLLLAALLLAGDGITRSWPLLAERSGFAAAARSLLTHHQHRVLTTTELMVFYLPPSGSHCGAIAMPRRKSGLAADVAAGYHYAVLERHESPITLFIRAHAHPAVAYLALGHMSIGESLISSENTHPPNPNEPPEKAEVYPLGHLPLPPPAHRAVSCDINIPV
jgi:Dolichyl-phosphate-mannose-protein mannosyltransferase